MWVNDQPYRFKTGPPSMGSYPNKRNGLSMCCFYTQSYPMLRFGSQSTKDAITNNQPSKDRVKKKIVSSTLLNTYFIIFNK